MILMIESMCVQLDLFSGRSLQEPIDALAEDDFREMAHRADITSEVIVYNPCIKCPYYGLCDSGECAAHCFELDCNDPYEDSEDKYDF